MAVVATRRRALGLSWMLAAILGAALPVLSHGGDQLAPDVLKKVKNATVYLRVTLPDDRVVEGSGFFGGASNVILTNRHVLGMLSADGRPPQKIEVIVGNGEAHEKTYVGKLAQVDPVADLAAVVVAGPGSPAPLPLAPAKELSETQTLFVFGFPFGKQLGKNITVSKTSVSSLRKDPAGRVRDVQVNGGMHPGNSGGPVVDAKGRVVGVAVAGVRGTQIHFAIASETVQHFLAGRMHVTVVRSPYREGDVVRLPITYRMVDPLGQIGKVLVDAWTGKPGPARKATAKAGGVEALPGDSRHETYPFTYEGHVAEGEIGLPPLSKDRVLWTQVSIVRRNGQRTWYPASPYAGQFAVVERKPVTLAYAHRPDQPCQLDLSTTTDLKLRALDGGDSHLVLGFKAVMLERTLPASGPDGLAGATFTFSRVSLSDKLDNKELPADKIMLRSLQSLRAVRALARVDKQGAVTPLKVSAAVSNTTTRQDLLWVAGQALQALEAVTVPLPGQEVSHDRPWKAQRRLVLGSQKRSQPAIIDVTYTYHGTRVRDGRSEALVFLQGEVRGQKGARQLVSGRMDGQAVIDLKTNQVRYADANLNLDLTLTRGTESAQANGTMRIALERKVLQGAERDKVLQGGVPTLPTQPADQPTTTPAGTIAKVIPGELFPFIRRSVKDQKLATVAVTGFKSPDVFRDVPAAGGVLIGFQVGYKKFFNNNIVGALRPIYRTQDGETMGAWIGKAPAELVTVKAKPGYAVSAIRIRTGLMIDGMGLTFTKLGKDRLVLDDHYDSDWIGAMGGNPSIIGGQGAIFIGVTGHRNNDGAPVALGLVTVVLPKE